MRTCVCVPYAHVCAVCARVCVCRVRACVPYAKVGGDQTERLVPRKITLGSSFWQQIGSRNYVVRYGLSVVCFRIGANREGENVPGAHMGLWGQQMWVSNRDFCQAVEKAIHVEDVGFVVLNLMSNNAGMRWSLAQTRSVLGYEPQDAHVPVSLPFTTRLRAALLRRLKRFAPNSPRELFQAAFMEFIKTDPRALYGDLVASQGWTTEERLSELALPILCVVGEHEAADARAAIDTLVERASDARRVEISGAAGEIPLEKPDELAEAIRSFLSEVGA